MKNRRSSISAFTLLELLLVIAIIALLLSILLPAMSAGRHAAMDLECRAKFRTVSQQFVLFCDPASAQRGPLADVDAKVFLLEDFQESIYKVDEFWDGGLSEREPLQTREHPLMCPASPGRLERRAGMPCSSGAVGPIANVSTGFNKRLETRTRYINDEAYPGPVYLSDRILLEPDVPLVFDVNGTAAAAVDQTPFYSAPPILDDKTADIYESGTQWFPAMRHRNRINVAFIGGHVLSSLHPLAEPWWRWSYQPDMP